MPFIHDRPQVATNEVSPKVFMPFGNKLTLDEFAFGVYPFGMPTLEVVDLFETGVGRPVNDTSA